MLRVVFIDAPGRSKTITASGGKSLMEVAVEHAIEGIEGMCGGGCACGTCHVVVDPIWIDRLDCTSSMEAELLNEVEGTTRNPDFEVAPRAKIKFKAGTIGCVTSLPLVWDVSATEEVTLPKS